MEDLDMDMDIEKESNFLIEILKSRDIKKYSFIELYTRYYLVHNHTTYIKIRKLFNNLFELFYKKIEKQKIIFERKRIKIIDAFFMYVFRWQQEISVNFNKRMNQILDKNLKALYQPFLRFKIFKDCVNRKTKTNISKLNNDVVDIITIEILKKINIRAELKNIEKFYLK